MVKQKLILKGRRDTFIQQAIELVTTARQHAVRQTNSLMVFTYFHIGRLIVEHEQEGSKKAIYGKATLKLLSGRLTKEFGNGFSVSNLEQMRLFFLTYHSRFPNSQPVAGKSAKDQIHPSLSAELEPNQKSEPVAVKSFAVLFPLSWTHYVILSRIENSDERSFYEIESRQNNWGKRELQRQLDSGLFERLALSKDKSKIKLLAVKGQIIEKPEDVLKLPYMLEFLGLNERNSYLKQIWKLPSSIELNTFYWRWVKAFASRAGRFAFLLMKKISLLI